jgi:glycosyltransferase involved in cell wall biosynthesis
MRVAVVHNLSAGGAWRRMRNQVRNLDADTVEVCLSTATPISASPVVVPLARYSERLPRALRPPAHYLDLLNLESAWQRATAHLQRLDPDVVFLNPCRFLQAPPIRVQDVAPVVYFCDEPRRVDYEPDAAAQRNQLTRPFYQPIYARERRLDARTARAVSLIATNSRYTAGEIQRAYGRTATVLKMGVAPAQGDPIDNHSPVGFLLSVGTLIPNKGHDLVVRAAAASQKKWTVRIVAPRPDPTYQTGLEDLARSLGVDLTVHTGVSDSELRGLYRGAFATLYLARREPLGLVALEAQAEGCPVIVANEGGLPETIDDGVSGWSCPRDGAAAAALLDRLSEKDVRGRMAVAARAQAAMFTWEESAAQLRELLRMAAS